MPIFWQGEDGLDPENIGPLELNRGARAKMCGFFVGRLLAYGNLVIGRSKEGDAGGDGEGKGNGRAAAREARNSLSKFGGGETGLESIPIKSSCCNCRFESRTVIINLPPLVRYLFVVGFLSSQCNP